MIFFKFFKPNVEKMKDKWNMPGLNKALKHKDPNIQEKAIDALIEGLIYDDSEIWEKAIEVLGTDRIIQAYKGNDKIQKKIVTTLINATKSENPTLKIIACRVIGTIKCKESIERLSLLIKYDKEVKVKMEAGIAIGCIGENESEKALIELFDKEGHYARAAAVKGLKLLESISNIDYLIDKIKLGWDFNSDFIDIIKKKKELKVAAVYLIKALNGIGINNSKNKEKKIAAPIVNALSQIGHPAVEPLVKALLDKDWSTREYSFEALYKMNAVDSDDVLNNLLNQLEKTKQYDRSSIINYIGRTKNIRAIDTLIPLLKDTYSSRDAAKALGNIGSERAVDSLIEALEPIGGPAVEALCSIGDSKATGCLLSFLFRKPRIVGDMSKIDSVYYNLFKDYTNIIMTVATVEVKRETHNRYMVIDSASISKSEEAMKQLCKTRTKVANNILILISQMEDLKVEIQTHFVQHDDFEGSERSTTYDFQSLVARAAEELHLRGNPLYDPTIYNDKNIFALDSVKVGNIWICTKCKEKIEDNFDSCWNCQTSRSDSPNIS